MFSLAISNPLVKRPAPSAVVAPRPLGKQAMQEPHVRKNVEEQPGTAERTTTAYSTQLPAAVAALSYEAQLIARAQAGDQTAFGALVEMHQDFVYNLSYRILQDAEEADDAAQESFVRIWQALHTFRGDAKFTTWAYRIVRNGCLNRIRSNKAGPRTVSVENSFEDGDSEGYDLIANLPGEQADEPDFQFDSGERRRVIWAQVDTLPFKYREIIALYYDQELSYEEIAAALEIPVGTVKTHLFRAKAQLKTKLLELHQNGAL